MAIPLNIPCLPLPTPILDHGSTQTPEKWEEKLFLQFKCSAGRKERDRNICTVNNVTTFHFLIV